jgi:aspartate aminotransferase
MVQLASRLAQFRPSPTVAMTALVRQLAADGKDIIGLVGGEPDFDTPEPIKDAGIRAIRAGNVCYTNADGTAELKRALAAKLKADTGLDRAPEQIVVSSGTKPLLHAAMLAMTDPGDEVIIPAPYWVSHPDIARMAGAVPVAVPCRIEAGFRLAPADLARAITPRTRVVLINSPHNPTGTVYTRAELLAIIDVLRAHPEIWVLTDEIYEHIVFGEKAPSIAGLDAEFAARVVATNGFSKGYVMMGWRLGFAAGPKPIMRAIADIVGQLVGSPSSISQAAAVEALTTNQSFLMENAAAYRERRDIAAAALHQMPGIRCYTPEGAFYLFADISETIGRRLPNGKVIETDEDFVRGAIEHAGVALMPGSAFGLSPYFRLSYSLDTNKLRDALTRLRRYCNELS